MLANYFLGGSETVSFPFLSPLFAFNIKVKRKSFYFEHSLASVCKQVSLLCKLGATVAICYDPKQLQEGLWFSTMYLFVTSVT